MSLLRTKETNRSVRDTYVSFLQNFGKDAMRVLFRDNCECLYHKVNCLVNFELSQIPFYVERHHSILIKESTKLSCQLQYELEDAIDACDAEWINRIDEDIT